MKRAPFFLLAASLLVSLPAGAAPGGGKRSLQLVEAKTPDELYRLLVDAEAR